jgi:hypothetical protein
MTRFLFEFEDEDGEWQSFGTGEGSGNNHLEQALNDLNEDEREPMVAGRWRYRPDDGETDRWQVFTLAADGHVTLE